MRRVRCAGVGTLVVLLAACGTEPDGNVGLDLSDLTSTAGTDEIDTIYVRVYDDADLLEWETELLSTDDYVDLVVSAGPSRRFEVEAVYVAAAGEIPTYWGESVMDITAGANVDLVVDIFPAGRLTGQVTVSGFVDVPEGSAVIATAVSPRLDAPSERELAIDWAGVFTGTLPDGDYDLTLDFTIDTTTYGRTDGGSTETVIQGEIVTAAGITVGAQ